ncbi:uncharacterized protein [Triticum aestivum]|uniref:uncharacterized protein n=1 Tax=Triticum aestivum TaxID=4565 RepID=UPI001D00896B|nr:uncharacterized protein LOC123067455 [Triticum aestivum]
MVVGPTCKGLSLFSSALCWGWRELWLIPARVVPGPPTHGPFLRVVRCARLIPGSSGAFSLALHKVTDAGAVWRGGAGGQLLCVPSLLGSRGRCTAGNWTCEHRALGPSCDACSSQCTPRPALVANPSPITTAATRLPPSSSPAPLSRRPSLPSSCFSSSQDYLPSLRLHGGARLEASLVQMLVWSARDVAPPAVVDRIGVGDVCRYFRARQLHNSRLWDWISIFQVLADKYIVRKNLYVLMLCTSKYKQLVHLGGRDLETAMGKTIPRRQQDAVLDKSL